MKRRSQFCSQSLRWASGNSAAESSFLKSTLTLLSAEEAAAMEVAVIEAAKCMDSILLELLEAIFH